MRNPLNSLAIFLVLLAFWVMLVAGTAGPLKRAMARASWEPTPAHCLAVDSLTERQQVACELAADTAYGPSLEERR